jgi:beta-hydroxylase
MTIAKRGRILRRAMPPLRYWILAIFLASAAYANLRGRVRFGWLRALTDYTVLLAPLNAVLYAASQVQPRPFLDAQRFAALDVLRANWRLIRDEALALNESGHIRAAAAYNDIGFNSFFRTGWTRFYLKWYGAELPSARSLCPRTVELLAALPEVKAAMFASLPPGGRLVRHRDPYAGSLRYHLGLKTPNSPGCYIEVDGQRYHWKDGEAIVFDETFIHHAENTTDQQRVILFCDVERPLRWRPMTAFNRWFAREVMTASETQNVAGERIGALNRLFPHVYEIRLAFKALKRRSRSGYYALKWTLFSALLVLVIW